MIDRHKDRYYNKHKDADFFRIWEAEQNEAKRNARITKALHRVGILFLTVVLMAIAISVLVKKVDLSQIGSILNLPAK